MALKPLSTSSKVVVYNEEVEIKDKTSIGNHQSVAVSEILALGGTDQNDYLLDVTLNGTDLEFTGQNGAFTGTIDLSGFAVGDFLPLTGGVVNGATTFTGGTFAVNSAEFKVEAFLPSIFLTDLNDDSDFVIRNNNGLFEIRDVSAPKVPFTIASDGTISMDASTGFGTTIYGGLTVGGGPLEVPFQGMIINDSSALGIGIRFDNNTGAAYNAVNFTTSVGQAGAIQVSNLITSYTTSSDYRLKENVVELTGAIDRVKSIPVKQFNFAGQAKTVDGFLAHELQAVIPEAVTGEKDAVDEEGTPIYQGVDQSKVVPLLTAALKEAIARIEALEAQVGI